MQNFMIFGNIGSGKSTFSQVLKSFLPSHQYLCIDDYRLELFAKSPERIEFAKLDRQAEEFFLMDFEKAKKIIWETTGDNRLTSRVLRNRLDFFKVKIECRPEVCLRRAQLREQAGYITAPMRKGKTLSQRIWELDSLLKYEFAHLTLNSERQSPQEMLKIFKNNASEV